MERVVIVIVLDVVAVEAFDVEEGTMEVFEARVGMEGALGETFLSISYIPS
jgi:hypothetical protein